MDSAKSKEVIGKGSCLRHREMCPRPWRGYGDNFTSTSGTGQGRRKLVVAGGGGWGLGVFKAYSCLHMCIFLHPEVQQQLRPIVLPKTVLVRKPRVVHITRKKRGGQVRSPGWQNPYRILMRVKCQPKQPAKVLVDGTSEPLSLLDIPC